MSVLMKSFSSVCNLIGCKELAQDILREDSASTMLHTAEKLYKSGQHEDALHLVGDALLLRAERAAEKAVARTLKDKKSAVASIEAVSRQPGLLSAGYGWFGLNSETYNQISKGLEEIETRVSDSKVKLSFQIFRGLGGHYESPSSIFIKAAPSL